MSTAEQGTKNAAGTVAGAVRRRRAWSRSVFDLLHSGARDIEHLRIPRTRTSGARALGIVVANFNSFERSIVLVTEIAKQNEGWLKSQREGRGRNRSVMPAGLAGPSAP